MWSDGFMLICELDERGVVVHMRADGIDWSEESDAESKMAQQDSHFMGSLPEQGMLVRSGSSVIARE